MTAKETRQGFWSGWKQLYDFLRLYWRAYGGWVDLFKSPYLHIALLITIACYGLWSRPDWWDVALTINPSILGFTLGGFAILLATATDKFGAILAKARRVEEDPVESPLAKLGGAFVHFILVQFISIIIAIIAKAAYCLPAPKHLPLMASDLVHLVFWGFGCLVAVYAIVCAVSTTEWIFRAIFWLIKFHKKRFRLDRQGGN